MSLFGEITVTLDITICWKHFQYLNIVNKVSFNVKNQVKLKKKCIKYNSLQHGNYFIVRIGCCDYIGSQCLNK